VRREGICAVALLLFALILPARAQHSAGAEIVLPPRLVAGQPATLAVLDASGRLAPGSAVELWDGSIVVTDSTGRARLTAPRTPGVALVWLAGGKEQASAVVLAPVSGVSSGVHLASVPQLVSRADRFFVSGAGFQGDADRNDVRLGGKPALVLAASPDSLVILPNPAAPLGPTRLEVGAAAAPVTLIEIELGSAKLRLARGQRAKLPVRVAGTDLPVELEARNLTPEIVKLRGGNLQRLHTRGGAENSATLVLEGLRPGDYSLEVRLVPPVSGLPDLKAARQALLEARRVAPPSRAREVDGLIRELGQDPQQYVRVRLELEKMLPNEPPGPFSRALEAAWETLRER
jgi:hypothetical protein